MDRLEIFFSKLLTGIPDFLLFVSISSKYISFKNEPEVSFFRMNMNY